ncbi:MAG: UDP-glucose/GDP-mannose dehydrogenase family protein [Nitrospirae bacterium]|nr:UDP-glucose/GDP-mannose dehydrogenase family protein [Nitrospirota bacterium]MBF0535514.1 UDP-glucose/GDP-mannose dehydrogenase family protein [Nitrospirota bacterium]MBF0617354.1 UDP-glucose/GDP-mannose dehydrogenase family protein [Nitrospirota bacterium]
MHIGMIGTGYVGLVTGACFSEFGVTVTCVDKDEKKIKSLNKGEIPFYEPGLKDLVNRNVKQGRLFFSTSISEAVLNSQAVFIAVGTPPNEDGTADLSHVFTVAKSIAEHINNYKVIVTKSTVPVGTGKAIIELIASVSGSKLDYDVVSNPEFLREGAAIEDFMRPDRIVIGAETDRAISVMKELYSPLYLIETPFVITNIETAELIKYAANAFLATKISFINEIANLCDKVNANVHDVSRAMGLDGRIGKKFLHPGPGFGGSCFPKDTRALITIANEYNVDLNVVTATVKTNYKQRDIMLQRIIATMDDDVNDKTLAILGLAFKPNTDDLRDAPAIYLIEQLLKRGAKIRAYDPAAMENAKSIISAVTFCTDVYSTIEGADATVLATEWNQFRNLDLTIIKNLMTGPYFFDLRNVYEPKKLTEHGFIHFSVGRR